jgi:4-aminobutyrate aminotransferase / (S)-3-amino-2-methylpropionate transaminase
MTAFNEPSAPSVLTTIPGPSTDSVKSQLDVIFDSRTVQLVIDYTKSSGN